MWGLQLPADFGGQTLSDLVFMRILFVAVWRIDYVCEEMEAGSNEEATAKSKREMMVVELVSGYLFHSVHTQDIFPNHRFNII